MKTRIKVVVRGDDSKIYYPQYRELGFWRNFTNYSDVVSFNHQAYAEDYLKQKLELELQRKRKKQIQSVDYINYP
jgi:hypothetical protein